MIRSVVKGLFTQGLFEYLDTSILDDALTFKGVN
jgi:hypothetical protein